MPERMTDVKQGEIRVVRESLSPNKLDHGITLWQIEEEKLALIELRDECATEEERAAVDAEVRKYVEAEISKVHRVAGLMRYFDAFVDTIKAEQERLAKKRAMWEGHYGRVRQMVLEVMQARGLRKIEGGTERFRIQKNGAKSVVVDDPAVIPDEYVRANIKMSMKNWKALLAAAGGYVPPPDAYTVSSELDLPRIGSAIAEAKASELAFMHSHGVDHPDFYTAEQLEQLEFLKIRFKGAHVVQGEHLRLE